MRFRRYILLVGLLLLLFWPGAVFGSDQIIFTPEVPLPNFVGGPVTGQTIAEYIRAVFVYFIWIVGLLATFMVVYGGVKWVSAAGNPGRINDARETINNAIIGLIIALTSVLLLNTINPRLTNFTGLTIQTIDQKLFIADIKAAAGELKLCDKHLAAGEPTQVCSGPTPPGANNAAVDYGCLDLNSVINEVIAPQKNSPIGVDAFAIKAIVNIESPKQNDQPFSGPQTNNGPAYGIGQFEISTAKEVLKKTNRGLPPGCRDNEILDPDGVHWSQDCKAWIDKRTAGIAYGGAYAGLKVQVNMIGYYFQEQLLNQSCVNGDFLLAAAAYNQGLGGASDSFCSTAFLKDQSSVEQVKAKALNYIAKFKEQYNIACTAGTD